MSLSVFSKVRGKDIYYVEFGKLRNLISSFGTKDFPESLKSVDCDLSSVGIGIKRVSISQHQQALKCEDISESPADEQGNILYILFYTTDVIDGLITRLNKCKEALIQKNKEKRAEEYRKKYYGKIVQYRDLLKRKGVAND